MRMRKGFHLHSSKTITSLLAAISSTAAATACLPPKHTVRPIWLRRHASFERWYPQRIVLALLKPCQYVSTPRMSKIIKNEIGFTIRQVPASTSQTGYSCGQQLSLSSQHVADSNGQQPQPKQNLPYWYTQQQVLPSGHVW